MKEITITKYEANDGTVFDTVGECEKHDKELENDIDNKIALVPHHFECQADLFFGIGMDDYILYFKPCEEEHEKILREWCKAHNLTIKANENELIGSVYVIQVYGYHAFDSIVWDFSSSELVTLHDFIGSFASELLLAPVGNWKVGE